MPKRLYFIAIELPEPLKSEITDWKNTLSKTYESKHALKTSPHITLQMPMRIEEERETELTDAILAMDGKIQSVDLFLRGISSFPPKTIFIEVVKSEHLSTVFERVQVNLYKNNFIEEARTADQFHPHVSLMNRDLSEKMFSKAWSDLKDIEYQEECKVNKMQLYKHDGKFWQILIEIRLQN